MGGGCIIDLTDSTILSFARRKGKERKGKEYSTTDEAGSLDDME